MMSDDPLDWLADHFGIANSYNDLSGTNQTTTRETKLALLRANGLDLATDKHIQQKAKDLQSQTATRRHPEEIVLNHQQKLKLEVPGKTDWHLEFENGGESDRSGRTKDTLEADDLPIGVHKLHLDLGTTIEKIRIIVAPPTAPTLRDLIGAEQIWGINAALYGLHSLEHPGIGNFQHLANAASICAQKGADFLGINPVHAIGWHEVDTISPYSPTHRGFLNTSHMAANLIEPKSAHSQRLIDDWNSAAGSKEHCAGVEYTQHSARLRPLLVSLFEDFLTSGSDRQKNSFFAFCSDNGASLGRFAQFECWGNAEASQNPESITAQSDPELMFHAWLQWHAEHQLAEAQRSALSAGMKLGLYLDLAVGSRRNGAEAWCEKDSIAEGISVGAPPDHLSPAGQNWNLAAFAPAKLAANDYSAFRQILCQTMRHCGVIRIDHVLGMNRSFWIPDDGSPGGYIRQNFEAMMALIRIEASRSNTIVVGEDLGLVPNGFREAMTEQNIYSYSVLQYEKDAEDNFRKPETFKRKSLVCFGTHDTPTLAGYLKGRDIDWWQKLNWIDGEKARGAKRERERDIQNLKGLATSQAKTEPDGFPTQRDAIYDILARSNAAMVSVQLDDVFGTIEAQNLPGTINEHPNWRRKYPSPIEHLKSDIHLEKISNIMATHDRSNRSADERT